MKGWILTRAGVVQRTPANGREENVLRKKKHSFRIKGREWHKVTESVGGNSGELRGKGGRGYVRQDKLGQPEAEGGGGKGLFLSEINGN